jgi:hypothetical protein
MSQKFEIDCSNPGERARFLRAFSALRGVHTITVTRNRKLRSNEQNRLYWGVYVSAFRLHLAAQGEPLTDNLIHEMLKTRFLRETVFHPVTGEVLGERVKSTTELSTTEFSEYLDNIAAFLADTFGIELPGIDSPGHPQRVTASLVSRPALPSWATEEDADADLA